jgi:hypothetical protein
MLSHLNYIENLLCDVGHAGHCIRQMSVEQGTSVWNTFVMYRGDVGKISLKVM